MHPLPARVPPPIAHSEPEESSSAVPALMLMVMGVRPRSCSRRLCRGRGAPGTPTLLPSLPDEPGGTAGRWALPRSLMGGSDFFRMPVGCVGASPRGWGASPRGGGHPALRCLLGWVGLEVPTPRVLRTFVGMGQGQQRGVPREGVAVGMGGVAPGGSLHAEGLISPWPFALLRRHELAWPVRSPWGHRAVTWGGAWGV